jgi:hypothetical protein
MSWATPLPDTEWVFSYEARLTPLCASWRMTAVCLYDLGRLSRHTFTAPTRPTPAPPRRSGRIRGWSAGLIASQDAYGVAGSWR